LSMARRWCRSRGGLDQRGDHFEDLFDELKNLGEGQA
jgi:hypothetical protein